MKTKSSALVFAFGLLFISSSEAAVSFETGFARIGYFLDIAGGFAFSVYGTTNHPVIVDVPENYVDTHKTNSVLLYGLFGGIQLPLRGNFALQTGVSAYKLDDVTVNGRGTQQDMSNFSYQYKVGTLAAYWESRLFYTVHKSRDELNFAPFIIAALGIANNSGHNYQTMPDDPETLVPSGFANHSKINVAYALGLGVQYVLNQHWSAALSYRYQHLGNASLGTLAGSPAAPLAIGTLNNNVALLDIQYRF